MEEEHEEPETAKDLVEVVEDMDEAVTTDVALDAVVVEGEEEEV